MSWITKIFKVRKLEKELEQAYVALKECNGKLTERQEVVNQTNAYWKKKMHELKNKKSPKKDL